MADKEIDAIDDDAGLEGEVEGDGDGEEGEAAAPARRRLTGRTLVLFVILPLAGLLAIAAGGYLTGMLDSGAETPEQLAARPKLFYELPEILVNLSDQGDERSRYLKLQVSLELPDRGSRDALEPVLPRVLDLFQVYLRELRPSDLDGSAGIYRLKEELVRRVNFEIHPHRVSDVLFKEIIVQ